MTKREIPWVPTRLTARQVGIAAAVIVLAAMAIVALRPKPTPTPAGSITIEGSDGNLGQLNVNGTGGVAGPPASSVDGPPSLGIDEWHQLFQGEIQ